MSNRFEYLYELPKELYCPDSPVIVSAGVLLKDTESKRLVAQLKFHSVSAETISALSVKLDIADTANRHLATLPEYHYLDLSATCGQDFGSNKAIPIPNPAARHFTIAEISVVFRDGSVRKSEEALTPLPQTVTLQEALADEEMVKQYQMATNSSAAYVPYTSMGLHQCSCGHFHRKPFCSVCGMEHAQAMNAYDIPKLAADSAKRIAEETAAREEQLARDKAAREAAKTANAYIKAQEKLLRARTAKDYQQAEAMFLALGDYRDSGELAAKCHEQMTRQALKKLETTKSDKDYKAAEALLASEDNAEQMQQLQESFDTRKQEAADKKKKVLKRICIAVVLIAVAIAMVPISQTYIIPAVKYSQADKLAQNAQYDEAIAAFTALGEYKDAQDRVWETTYNKAVSLMEAAQYTEASEIFADLHGYADSREKVLECAYLHGKQLMAEQQFEWAIKQFMAADGFADANELLNECYLILGEAEHSNTNYEKALEYFRLSSASVSENTVYVDTVYQAALLNMEQGINAIAVDLFSEIPGYEDSDQKRIEAMYAYVTANPTNTDPETYTYITELKELGYEDAAKLYDEIYTWGIVSVANYSSADTDTNKETLSGSATVYVHFTITGGEPDASLPVHAKIKYPNGTSQSFEFGEMTCGDHNYVYFNSWGNYAKGTCTLTVYNSETNKAIGSHTLKLS